MNTEELIRQYFRSKAQQLLAASDEAICEHPGLKGSHREDLIKLYLKDIVPKKFDIGKGMIYSPFHKSKEADIVVWDSQSYPSLQLYGHSMFFAESVRLMVEVKTTFSSSTMKDIQDKSEATKNIVPGRGLSIEDELLQLKAQVYSLASGEPLEGILHSKHHIATGAFVFKGGSDFKLSKLTKKEVENADDAWPDILILLEAGKVIVKQYDDNEPYIELIECGEDSLLVFTSYLLSKLSERSVNVEDPFYLSKYVWRLFDSITSEKIVFRPTRWIPGSTII